MNKGNILKLAALLEQRAFGESQGFSLRWYRYWDEKAFSKDGKHKCGSVMCIGGWAALLSGEAPSLHEGSHRWQETGQKWLGLDEDQAFALFEPPSSHRFNGEYGVDYERVTPEQAAQVLRAFVAIPDDDEAMPNWQPVIDWQKANQLEEDEDGATE